MILVRFLSSVPKAEHILFRLCRLVVSHNHGHTDHRPVSSAKICVCRTTLSPKQAAIRRITAPSPLLNPASSQKVERAKEEQRERCPQNGLRLSDFR